MAFRTAILIANVDEALAVADSDAPTTNWAGFTCTGFDDDTVPIQLCTLLSLLRSGSAEAYFERYLHSIEIVESSKKDWPLVSILKPKQVRRIASVASLDDAEIEQLAASWGATDEFDGWIGSDVRDLLRQLADVANTARSQHKCIMIWRSP